MDRILCLEGCAAKYLHRLLQRHLELHDSASWLSSNSVVVARRVAGHGRTYDRCMVHRYLVQRRSATPAGISGERAEETPGAGLYLMNFPLLTVDWKEESSQRWTVPQLCLLGNLRRLR